jgi:drug/metabolite transporter (DMT)-like permease
VPTSAFLLVLGSAVLHAGWNLAIKASGDRLITAAGQVVLGAAACAPILAFTGLPHGAWRAVALSSLVHLAYGLSLVAAYDRGDLSAVYPVARGSAPALVAIAGVVLLGDSIAPVAWGAIAVIVAAIVVIGLAGRPRGISWALATGALITIYTTIDTAAVRDLDTAVGYTICIFIGNGLLFALAVGVRRSVAAIGAGVRTEWWRMMLGGGASALAYILVLAAARVAPIGLVSAVRETSVVIGALAGWRFLGEPLAGRRVGAAVAIAAGLAVIAVQ